MIELMKAFLTSKKAAAFLAGVIFLTLTSVMDMAPAIADEVVKLIMAYIVGQGLADLGSYQRYDKKDEN